MKKATLWIVVLLLIGQQAVGQQNIIKFNPFALALKQTSFGYERVVSENTSGQLYANYVFWDSNRDINLTGLDFGVEEINVTTELTGVRFIPSARFYVLDFQQAPEGFYVEPFLDLLFTKFNATGVDNNIRASGSIDINAIMGGGTIGYQFLIKEQFSIDLFAGAELAFVDTNDITLDVTNTTTNETETLTSPIDINLLAPFVPRFGISVGYVF